MKDSTHHTHAQTRARARTPADTRDLPASPNTLSTLAQTHNRMYPTTHVNPSEPTRPRTKVKANEAPTSYDNNSSSSEPTRSRTTPPLPRSPHRTTMQRTPDCAIKG